MPLELLLQETAASCTSQHCQEQPATGGPALYTNALLVEEVMILQKHQLTVTEPLLSFTEVCNRRKYSYMCITGLRTGTNIVLGTGNTHLVSHPCSIATVALTHIDPIMLINMLALLFTSPE